MGSRLERQLSSNYQLMTPQYSGGGINNINMAEEAASIQRARSKDSLQLHNNLRDVYKQIGGAQRVLQEGRIESQRLLMENYRKIDPQGYGHH